MPDGQGTGGYSVSGGVALSTLVTGLVAYWSLDETSGTRYDSVGSSDLTDNNTVGSDTGKNGNAASFVAANSEKLSVADSANTVWGEDGNGVTVSMWVKPTRQAGLEPLFVRNSGTRNFELFDAQTGSGVYFFVQTDEGDMRAQSTEKALNQFYHVVAWFYPTDKKTYLSIDNGTPTTCVSAQSSTSLPAAAGDVAIGGWAITGDFFEGLIDEVAIWSRVLTSDERAELYNSGTGKFYNGTNFV